MHSLGATHLLALLLVAVLLLDSRRLHALVSSAVGHRRGTVAGRGIPAGLNADKVGLPLRQIQMRTYVDWEDGGIGWEGPEILPADVPPTDTESLSAAEPSALLPVLWKPFPAFFAVPETEVA